jgi:hypothetical protein
MNGIRELLEGFANFGGHVGDRPLGALTSLALALLIPNALCAYNHSFKDTRSVFVYRVLVVLGVIIASFIPVEKGIPHVTYPVLRTLILIFCIITIIYVPRRLPFYLVEETGLQPPLRRIVVTVVAVLTAFAVFSKGN